MPRRMLSLVAAAVLAATGTIASGQPAGATGHLDNPGFEADGATQSPTGWSESSGTGHRGASFVEPGGHGGDFRLTHWADMDYTVTTSRTLFGLRNGTYTLAAWVRSDGDQTAAHIGLRDCGRTEQRTELPRTGGSDWVRIVVSTKVTTKRCTIVLHSEGTPGDWAHFDDIEFARGAPDPLTVRGGDVSTLKKNEDFGAVYYDRDGDRDDALSILRGHGMNWARLKVWVNPTDGYNTKAHVLEMARRIKALRMGLVIDFHYSDTWADPGKQFKPRAWEALSFPDLQQAVYDHTYDVLRSLWRQGTPAHIAQIGNEINGGMLWPDGRWDNWDGLAALLTSASTAVSDASPRTEVMLHLAEGGNNGGHVWWFDNATSRGVPFDVIGVSHYTFWHGTYGALQANIADLSARYDKDVIVMETAWGFTLAENDSTENIFNASLRQAVGYPASPAGQAKALRDMFTVLAGVPGNRVRGAFYWEPTWTAVEGAGWDPDDPTSGDGWENQAVFDYEGRALPAIEEFAGPQRRNRH